MRKIKIFSLFIRLRGFSHKCKLFISIYYFACSLPSIFTLRTVKQGFTETGLVQRQGVPVPVPHEERLPRVGMPHCATVLFRRGTCWIPQSAGHVIPDFHFPESEKAQAARHRHLLVHQPAGNQPRKSQKLHKVLARLPAAFTAFLTKASWGSLKMANANNSSKHIIFNL